MHLNSYERPVTFYQAVVSSGHISPDHGINLSSSLNLCSINSCNIVRFTLVKSRAWWFRFAARTTNSYIISKFTLYLMETSRYRWIFFWLLLGFPDLVLLLRDDSSRQYAISRLTLRFPKPALFFQNKPWFCLLPKHPRVLVLMRLNVKYDGNAIFCVILEQCRLICCS